MQDFARPHLRALLRASILALTVVASGLVAGLIAAQADTQEANNRILFVSDRDKPDEYAVFSMKPDGSDQIRLSKGEGILFDPAWSPDHKQIVFSRVASHDKPVTSLCVMKADGSDTAVVVPEEEQTLYVAASWSPDGKHIAYSAAHFGGAELSSTIYIVDPDGKNRKKVVDGIVPVWSPDSKRLLYSPSPISGVPALKSVDLDGANVKTLAEKGLGPAWSPDGKRIAFASDNNGHPALFVMDADGSHVTLLTKDADTLAVGPVWTQDARHILFARLPKEDGGKPHMEICLMDADGGNVKAVTKPDSFLGAGTSVFFLMRMAGK